MIDGLSEGEKDDFVKTVTSQRARGDTELIQLPKESELNKQVKATRLERLKKRIEEKVALIWVDRWCEFHKGWHTYVGLTSSPSAPECHENVVFKLGLKQFKEAHTDWTEEEVERQARMSVAMEQYKMRPDAKGGLRYEF